MEVWHARCQRADATGEDPQRQLGPGTGGEDGRFEIMIVTADDERHELPASAASVTAVVALAQADTVMMWDPPANHARHHSFWSAVALSRAAAEAGQGAVSGRIVRKAGQGWKD